jgi:WD40 repeat protein
MPGDLAVSPKGDYLAFGWGSFKNFGGFGLVDLLGQSAGESVELQDLGEGWSFPVAFSRDGAAIALGYGTATDGGVAFWKLSALLGETVFSGVDETWPTPSSQCIGIDDAGKFVAFRQVGTEVRVAAGPGRPGLVLQDGLPRTADEYRIRHLAVAPRGGLTVAAIGRGGSRPDYLELWKIADAGSSGARFDESMGAVVTLAIGDSAARFAVASTIPNSKDSPGMLELWDAVSLKRLWSASLDLEPRALAFDEKSGRIAVGLKKGDAGVVRLWDPQRPDFDRSFFDVPDGNVAAIALSPHGEFLGCLIEAIGMPPHNVTLWHVPTGTMLASFPLPNATQPESLDVGPDGAMTIWLRRGDTVSRLEFGGDLVARAQRMLGSAAPLGR